MDSLTHIVLGACIGELIAGKELGKRAMIIGAIAQSIPDIDSVAGFWLNEVDDIVAHRSLTHSILFAVLVSWLLSWLSVKIFRRHNVEMKTFLLLFSVNIFFHIFIDTFNAYGTEFLYPFNDTRFSFNLLFVADPLFSLWPLIAFVWLLIVKTNWHYRKKMAGFALVLSFVYIGYAATNKMKVDKAVTQNLKERHIAESGYFTSPTILNSWLWYIVVKQEDGYKIGYRSVFDKTDSIFFNDVKKNDNLIKEAPDKEDATKLIQFSSGYYTFDKWNDTLVLNVLRFGQVGSHDPSARFAFHYFLNKPEANKLVIQRGRFKNMNRERIAEFIRRVRGI